MRDPSLPPGFGFDPGELGTSRPRPVGPSVLAATQAADKPPVASETDVSRPTLTVWVDGEGHDEDAADTGTGRRRPVGLLVTTAMLGIVLLLVAYVLDMPMS